MVKVCRDILLVVVARPRIDLVVHVLNFFMFKQLEVKAGSDRCTRASFFKRLCWSLYALEQGVWPTHDEHKVKYAKGTPEGNRAGKYLADGYVAHMFAVLGGLDQHAYHGLNSSGAADPCLDCKANLKGYGD